MINRAEMRSESHRLVADVKYQLLRSILAGSASLDEVCARAGLSTSRVEQILLTSRDVTIRDVASLAWACGVCLDFRMRPR